MIRAPVVTLSGLAFFCVAATTCAEDAPSAPPARDYQLQLGLYFTAIWNDEQPFLNLVKSMNGDWSAFDSKGPVVDTPGLRSGGYLDDKTGLPKRLPDGAVQFVGSRFLLDLDDHPGFVAGHYALEWDGEANGYIQGQPRELQSRSGENSLRFFVPYDGKTFRQLRFSMIRGDGVKAVRIFREEYRDLIEAGEIWNPVFLDYAKRYDIIRTMDMQATNASPVRRFADVARPEDAFYSNRFEAEWPAAARYGAPFEVLFDLANKSGAKLWLNIPPMIGAPLHPAHPSLRQDDHEDRVDGDKIRAMARIHGREIVASGEWEIFAKEFVDRLVAAGYPPDKPLYIELGNEIWNFGAPFYVHTHYAWGVGQAFNSRWGMRQGYGVLSARWASALESELAARGLDYNIVYVLASQTAWPERTSQAIEGYKRQLENAGDLSGRILSRTGVALTTYSHCSKAFGESAFGKLSDDELRAAWEQAIYADREGLKKRLRDYCVNGPASEGATRAWIVKNWRAHQQLAEKEGIKLLGAYEGGSHDYPKKLLRESEKFRAWWKEYHWGPYGADVVRQVNRAVAEAFPGIILSNYASMGEIGDAPWFDGHYAEETAMLRMWDEFANPPH